MRIPASEVTIKNLATGKVLVATRAGKGAAVGQCSRKDKDGNDVARQWRLIPVTGARHQYQIQNVATGTLLEISEESHDDKASVLLWEDNGGSHQQWRLIPMGEGGHEYVIMNVNSGKVLDVWDGSKRDDADIVQLGYGTELQQRWIVTSCKTSSISRAVMTMVRNEKFFLPIWLRYYSQFFAAQDIYVLDHESTDGSTEGQGFIRIPVSHPEYGAGWQTSVNQRHQHDLIDRYDVVLCTDVDEIVAPDPRLDDLGTYIDRFDENFVNCQGFEVLHQKNSEPPLDLTKPILSQRFEWYANPLYTKPLLARVPMLWWGGCHNRIDDKKNNDPNLYLIHLHRMDYDICLARHHDRASFPLEQIDRERGWGYQNQITDPTKFSSWFYHDSCGPLPIHPEPIPSWWRDLV